MRAFATAHVPVETCRVGSPAGPTSSLVQTLVELLGSYRPDRAAQLTARLAGPAPDGLLVIGPDDASVGRLATALAAALPDRCSCAPADAAPCRDWLDRTRAVVWVCHAGAPTSDRHWATLGRLAGEIDEVHLVFAGIESHRDWAGVLEADQAGLALAVPRLAGQPIYRIADGPQQLVSQLHRDPVEDPGRAARRNAMRYLRSALGQLLTERESRCRNAELHGQLGEQSMRRHREQLTADRLALASEWPKRVRADLAEVALALSGEAAAALRRLRQDAVDQIEQADRAARTGFPARLAAASVSFTAQLVELADRSYADLEREVRNEAGDRTPSASDPSQARCIVGPPPTPPIRSQVEDRLVVAVGVAGSVGLIRFVLTGAHVLGSPFGAATLPLAIGFGVGAGYWLVRVRRAAHDRAVLTRWAGEVLAELRRSMEELLSQRLLATERGLHALVDRAVARRAAELDSLLREHELLTRARVGELARDREQDQTELTRLREGCARLDRLLERPGEDARATREVS